MSSLRARTIRLAFANPELRPNLLPILQSITGTEPSRFVNVGNPLWTGAAEAARQATVKALPPCRCMGPTVTILDEGRGPIMEVTYGHDITPEEVTMMDLAVSELGWRGWGYDSRGIAFKPTSVRLARSHRIAAESRDPTPQEVAELRKYVRTVLKTNVTPHTSKDGVTVTVLKPQGEASGDQYVRVVDYLIKNGWVSWPSGDTKTLVEQKANAEKYDAFYNISLLRKAV
jgi:hypothetical protein